MDIRTGYGQQIRVKCIDGKTFEGFYSIYTRAGDNTPEIASIVIENQEGLIEIYENEITNIEILD